MFGKPIPILGNGLAHGAWRQIQIMSKDMSSPFIYSMTCRPEVGLWNLLPCSSEEETDEENMCVPKDT